MDFNNDFTSTQDSANSDISLDLLNEDNKLIHNTLRMLHDVFQTYSKNPEKKAFIRSLDEQCIIGIEETNILKIIYTYIVLLGSEKMKVDLRVENLSLENQWLKSEMSYFTRWSNDVDNRLRTETEIKSNFENRYIYLINKSQDNVTEYHKNDMSTGLKVNDIQLNDLALNKDISTKFRPTLTFIIEYTHQGRFELALGLCKRVLNDINKKKDNLEYGIFLYILGILYDYQENYSNAASAFEIALKALTKICEDSSLFIISIYNNLILIYEKLKRYKEAESYCRQALLFREKHLSSNTAGIAYTLVTMASIAMKTNKPRPEIENHLQTAINIFYKLQDKYYSEIVKTTNCLADYYILTNKKELAEKVLHEIIFTMIRDNNKKMKKSNNNTNKDILVLIELLKNDETASKITREVEMEYYKETGVFSDLEFKDTFLLLESIYSSQNKDKLAKTVNNYIYWSICGDIPSLPVQTPPPDNTADFMKNDKSLYEDAQVTTYTDNETKKSVADAKNKKPSFVKSILNFFK